MAHWMGAARRVGVCLLLLLGLVSCTAAPVVPGPKLSLAAPANLVSPNRPTVTAATTPVATRPVAIAAAAVQAPAGLGLGLPAVRGRVLLDPGHGGKDTGAQAGGMDEKSLVLEVSLGAAEELRRRGVTVKMTRRNDTFIELEDRVSAANAFGADLFIAIHADVNPSPAKLGHSILLPQSGNPKARIAAQWLDRDLTAVGSPSYTIRDDNRGLYVLRHTTCPAILLEVGFLSNPIEAGWLRTAAYRKKLSLAIANGVIAYLQHR